MYKKIIPLNESRFFFSYTKSIAKKKNIFAWSVEAFIAANAKSIVAAHSISFTTTRKIGERFANF